MTSNVPPSEPPSSSYKEDKYLALAEIHKNPDKLAWNCSGMSVVFTAPASLLRTTTPNRAASCRLPLNGYEAYHIHEHQPTDDIVDKHRVNLEPLLPLRIASYDAEYVLWHSTLIVPVNKSRRRQFGQSLFTTVFVQKWCAEIIKAHREFLAREYIVLYPEVYTIESDGSGAQFMRVEALGAIMSPHIDLPRAPSPDSEFLQSGVPPNGAPFYFGEEHVYRTLREPINTDRCVQTYRHTGWCGVDGQLCAYCSTAPLDNETKKKRHRDD